MAGCPQKKDVETAPEAAKPETSPAEPETAVQPTEPVKREPPTAASLAPVIREEGEEGVVPSAITVELAEPAGVQGEPVRKGTVLEITPATPGTLSMRSSSTLVFSPNDGFQPATQYTVRLLSFETAEGTVTFPKTATPERSFTTPAFAFVRIDFISFDPKKSRLETALVYSAPVDVKDIEKKSTFNTADFKPAKILFERTEHKNVIRATITDKRLEGGSEVDFEDEHGVAGTVEIREGKPIKIHASYVQEGASGFYVMVVCSDAGSQKKEERFYYWDNVLNRSYNLSPRCVLEESDALESVHFSPRAKFHISPTRGGFRILGDFSRGTYSMRIDANARSIDGGVLKGPYTATFSVPARKPQLSFVSQGRYLPKSAWNNLAVRHMNTSKVELMIRNVPTENLVFWMSAREESPDARTSDIILKKTIALQAPPDQLTTTWVDVSNLLPSPPRGLLELRLTAPGASASSRLLVTDLNLVAKAESGSKQIHVWALDMHGNQAVPGVTVKAVVQSGRVFATCNTDRLGGCVLKPQAEAVDPAEPFALIATREGDITYLVFEQLRTEIADSQVHGRPFTTDSPYRAGIYGDRGVYRPGETARVTAILRDGKDVAPPPDMPVEVKLLDPRQKVARKLLKKTNVAGVIAMDFKFDDFATTGVYRVTLESGKKVIGEYSFNVEEFVPERMKVTATIDKPDYPVGEKIPVKTSARYLFGGSAEGSKVELACELRPALFSPKTNSNYDYGIWRPEEKPPEPIALGTASGVLDAEGTARISCPAAKERGGFVGTSRLTAKVAVFEAGSGRTTQGDASAMVHPESFYIGLTTGTRKVKAGEPFKVEGVVVDWTGQISSSGGPPELEVELFRVEVEHDWIYDEEQGRWSHRRYSRIASEGKLPKTKVENGKFSLMVNAGTEAGAFVVRAKAARAQTDLRLEGAQPYWYWWSEEGGRDETPRPLKPAAIDLAAPATLEVGKKATISFQSPFNGRALMSIETNRVVSAEWVDVVAGKVEYSFSLPEFAPNVYLSAFVVKDPHQDSKESFLPSRGFGIASVRVEPKEFTQNIQLDAPKEVRSQSKLEVKLDLGELDEPTFATVAAVDEGILSLTKFQSPDPLALLFDRRALGVSTFETIGWNLMLPAGGNSRSEGGDGDSGMGRVQPVKPVALWSGLIEIPKNGKTTVSFDVPQYRGSLRVMVVAAGTKKLGRAAANVLVRDPIVVQTTLPRFMTFGDRAEVPVFLTNLSGKPATVEVSIAAESLPVPGLVATVPEGGPPVEVEGEAKRKVELADGASGTALFKIKSLRAVGAAKLRVKASSGDHTSEESLDVPFVPAAPKSREVQRIQLSAGRTDIKKYLSGWVPTTERSTIWVTGNPYGDSFDHLKYLIHYPYGCLEQTISSTRPLLYVASFVQSVDPELVAQKRIETMVMFGVNRILGMQTPSGGFAYWTGGQDATPWGTAYATHLLIDAQKLRYPIPEDRVKDALEWIERELTTRYENRNVKQGDLYYWEDAEAYLHYVLALSGKGRKAWIEKLIDIERAEAKKDSESAEQLYMLQAALYLAGDRSHEAELKNPDTSPIAGERRNNWSFYSDQRRRGFMLSTFTELFGADPAGEKLAHLVAESMRGHSSEWYTTQELVWSLTGLGKRVGQTTKDFSVPVLIANGKKPAPETGPGAVGNDRSWAVARASEHQELAIELADTKGGNVFLVLSSEGVKENAKYQVGGEGLSLTREYRRVNGEPFELGDGSIELGDVVYELITISNKSGVRVQNIALTDRFPASFEIENPRLGRGSTVLSWVSQDQLWTLDYMNLRDDRIELFGALETGQAKKFVYALRAVTAGQFAVPTVEAGAMYIPALWAREAGGRAVVKGIAKE